MKSSKPLLFYSLIAIMASTLYSCEKDKAQPVVDVIYTVAVDGLDVTFTNQTKGATSYKWDFGDGTSSTEASPEHTYPSKGKFVPTLYVTTADGATYEGSTVLRISKGSPVKLDDNTLTDWDTLNNSVITSGAGGGIFKKVKFDYNGEYIFFYIEMASKKSNGDIFDFYIDSDNNPATGFITGMFKESGNDVLIEGQLLIGEIVMLYHFGAQDGWNWDDSKATEFYKIGTIQESAGLLKFEGKFVRSKIKGLTGKGFKIGIAATKSDWSVTLGTAPDSNTAAFFVDTSD